MRWMQIHDYYFMAASEHFNSTRTCIMHELPKVAKVRMYTTVSYFNEIAGCLAVLRLININTKRGVIIFIAMVPAVVHVVMHMSATCSISHT